MNMALQTKDMLGRSGVVSHRQALAVIRQHLPATCPEDETLPLAATSGRITAAPIRSPENLPPHPRSTMDGYAVKARDTFGATESMPAYLEVDGEVVMGELPSKGPGPGACARIATGGLLPPGTDAVVMLEHTVLVDEHMIEVVQPVAVGSNIINTGEDVCADDEVLPVGHKLRAQDLGLLAGLGIDRVKVSRKVRVAVLSTGDELVPYDQTPLPGKIRDMNGMSLAAMVEELGGVATYYGIAPDRLADFRQLAEQALAENDVVLFSGSSSVGARDLGETILDSIGSPGIILHGVAIKPGKPVIVAMVGHKPMFGLPGHPVSAAVAFDQFVRPVLQHLAGERTNGLPERRQIKATLMRNVNSAAGRRDFVRVRVEIVANGEYFAWPVLGKSGALSTMVKAQGFLVIAEEQQGLRQGEIIYVELF